MFIQGRVVEDMRFEDVAAPNVQTYTTLVSACATARDGPGALATVREMATRGVEPNEVTFRTALRACVGHPDDDPPPFARAILFLSVSTSGATRRQSLMILVCE